MKTGNPNFGRLSKHLHGKFRKLWNSLSYFGTCHIYICMTLFHCTFHLRLRLTRLWNEISPCNPHVPIPCAPRHPHPVPHGTHTSLTSGASRPNSRGKARWHPLSNISMRNTTKLYLALFCCHVTRRNVTTTRIKIWSCTQWGQGLRSLVQFIGSISSLTGQTWQSLPTSTSNPDTLWRTIILA